MEVIKKGTDLKYYDLKCPRCHSILRVSEAEIHEYEDCHDRMITVADRECPNCGCRDVDVESRNLSKYEVKRYDGFGSGVSTSTYYKLTILALLAALFYVLVFL